MNTIYKKWFELQLFHNYFESGLCKEVQLIPFKDTEMVFKNYDIRIKPDTGSFSFYMGVGKEEELSADEMLSGINALYFVLKTSDSHFYNYTQIPFASAAKTLFLDTAVNQNGSMQKENWVGESDLINVRPIYFNLALSEDTILVQVKDTEGDTVFEVSKNSFLQNKCSINLRGVAPGLLEIWINGSLSEKFLYLNEPADTLIGVVRISISDIDTAQIPVFRQVKFNSREAFWQYKIGSTSTKTKIKKMEVYRGEESVFEGPDIEKLANGQEVSVFISPTPFMFREGVEDPPILKLDYSATYSSEVNSMDIKLPNPEPVHLKFFKSPQNENHLLVSTIVYV